MEHPDDAADPGDLEAVSALMVAAMPFAMTLDDFTGGFLFDFAGW